MHEQDKPATHVRRTFDLKQLGRWAGPGVFLLVMALPVTGELSVQALRVAAALLWIVIWWATEAVPIAITSLLPLVLFPLLGIDGMAVVAGRYSSPVVYLLIGGFILALALEKAQLHRRLALMILRKFSGSAAAIIGGFMVATALMSMWISNTASTLIMVPIALSIVAEARGSAANASGVQKFEVALLLAVAFSASVGGLGTMVGSPPNLLMVGFLKQEVGIDISFTDWMKFGLPVVALLLPVIWLSLTRFSFPISNQDIDLPAARRQIDANFATLGKLSRVERRVALVFGGVALCWITRPLLQGLPGLGHLSDTAIALAGAIVLFLVPSGKGGSLMDWQTAQRLPWNVVLLYGGGMAVAGAMTSSGLTDWLVAQVIDAEGWHLLTVMLSVTALTLLLTELTNNSAALATLLPVLAGVAAVHDYPLLALIVPATLATSCAFMLPVATPPNAIVFGTGKITIPQMAAAGITLNLLGLGLITLLCFVLLT